MQQYPGYVDHPGLQQALGMAGVACWWETGNFYVSDLTKAQAVVASYNPVPAMQDQAVAQVQSLLSEKIAAGFIYNGVTIGIQSQDIVNINSMASQAMLTLSPPAGVTPVAWPSNFAWLPQGAGASLPLTAAEMLAMANSCAHYVSALILYADSMIAQIQAATTASEVQAIDITSGWPTS